MAEKLLIEDGSPTKPWGRPAFRYFPSVIRSKRSAEGRRFV